MCYINHCSDTYEKANALSKVAEETSNLESNDESASGKRKRTATTYLSDSENGDGMHHLDHVLQIKLGY